MKIKKKQNSKIDPSHLDRSPKSPLFAENSEGLHLKHHYGPQVTILQNSFMNTILAQLCSPHSQLPQIHHFTQKMYEFLLYQSFQEGAFETEPFRIPTRMTTHHPEAFLNGIRVKPNQKVVCLNLARAGSLPSQTCFIALHDLIQNDFLRQDHIFASRIADADHHVVGTQTSSYKIGGSLEKARLVIPDPMGATGSTLSAAIELYKKQGFGTPHKVIALHLIITPEYIKKVLSLNMDIQIFALRLDRGLSSKKVLESTPGTYWDQERGLNEMDYIVPGAGGLGEILNNSYC